MPRKEPGTGDTGLETEDLIEGGAAAGEEVRLHEFLSNDEVMAARQRARDKLEKERRSAAMKRIQEEEEQRLRLEEGLVTGDQTRDELVSISIDLAPHSEKIVINGMAYHHGFSYDVQRHVADTLREIMYRGWQHQDEIDGKNKMQQHAANRQFALLKKGKEAASGARLSMSTGAVGGQVPKNVNLRPGPEDHANV